MLETDINYNIIFIIIANIYTCSMILCLLCRTTELRRNTDTPCRGLISLAISTQSYVLWCPWIYTRFELCAEAMHTTIVVLCLIGIITSIKAECTIEELPINGSFAFARSNPGSDYFYSYHNVDNAV